MKNLNPVEESLLPNLFEKKVQLYNQIDDEHYFQLQLVSNTPQDVIFQLMNQAYFMENFIYDHIIKTILNSFHSALQEINLSHFNTELSFFISNEFSHCKGGICIGG